MLDLKISHLDMPILKLRGRGWTQHISCQKSHVTLFQHFKTLINAHHWFPGGPPHSNLVLISYSFCTSNVFLQVGPPQQKTGNQTLTWVKHRQCSTLNCWYSHRPFLNQQTFGNESVCESNSFSTSSLPFPFPAIPFPNLNGVHVVMRRRRDEPNARRRFAGLRNLSNDLGVPIWNKVCWQCFQPKKEGYKACLLFFGEMV